MKPELVRAQPVLRLDFGKDEMAFVEDVRYPPCKGRFLGDAIGDGILGQFNRRGLFKVLK